MIPARARAREECLPILVRARDHGIFEPMCALEETKEQATESNFIHRAHKLMLRALSTCRLIKNMLSAHNDFIYFFSQKRVTTHTHT